MLNFLGSRIPKAVFSELLVDSQGSRVASLISRTDGGIRKLLTSFLVRFHLYLDLWGCRTQAIGFVNPVLQIASPASITGFENSRAGSRGSAMSHLAPPC